jgi:DNA-binding protein H-NS
MGMVKMSISVRQYVYDKYLAGVSGNKSAYIEEMLVRGIEAETAELSDIKTKYIELNKEHKTLISEVAQLKKELGRYKNLKQFNGMTPEEHQRIEKLTAFSKGLKNAQL